MRRNGIGQNELLYLKEKMDAGLSPQWIITDPDIYELELKKIYGHTWQFLAHESELTEAGSYVTRWMAHDPILVVRTKDNEIKAFLNSCTHRGVKLCSADLGNKKSFTCPYHGWTFNLDGGLVGVVVEDKVYQNHLDREKWGLRPVPQVANYRGMIFGTLEANAMPLEEYLGDMKWYLDIFLRRSDKGLEVRGVPQRWIVNANWKTAAENFVDPYHVHTAHRSTVELGMSPSDPLYSGYGHQIVLEHGHGLNCITATPPGTTRNRPPYQGLPSEMWPMFERNLNKGQLDVFSKATALVGTVFPNLSFLSPVHGNEGNLHNYLNFRVWRPLARDKVEIWSWFMIDKAAPEQYKEEAYKAYVGSFGPSGTLEQDDTVIWERQTEASGGLMVRDKDLSYNHLLHFAMGLGYVEPDEHFPGPGAAYPTTYVDAASRGIHNYWLELLMREV